MSSTPSALNTPHMWVAMTVEETDHLISALQRAKRAALRDVEMHGDEGVDATVMLCVRSDDHIDIQTMESWITSLPVEQITQPA